MRCHVYGWRRLAQIGNFKMKRMIFVGFMVCSHFAAAAPPVEVPEARGTPSCGEWIVHRKDADTLALSNASWLVGYLSGLAVGAVKDFLPGTDNSAIFAWMDGYCRANPLKDVGSGGALLMTELMAKKSPRK